MIASHRGEIEVDLLVLNFSADRAHLYSAVSQNLFTAPVFKLNLVMIAVVFLSLLTVTSMV